jgi:hypothetical protein
MKQPMLLPDPSMQESSRGASPEWASLRGPSAIALSQRINLALVEKLFLFFADDGFISRITPNLSGVMFPNPKYNFVVDSPILSVI